ncbi:MAG: hypothetical protein ABIT36_13535 [Steroidobacteraceae bacterium]
MTPASHSLHLASMLVLASLVQGCKPDAAQSGKPAEPVATASIGCLPKGDGFLRAQLHGARELQLDWADAQMSCEGGPRPDGNGIRVSISGSLAEGESLRFVFGIGATKPGENGRALATNLTAILEREHRIYATLGDDKCTVDELRQQPVPGVARGYRVQVRGFCIEPATVVGGNERLLISTFDFAALIRDGDPPAKKLPVPAAVTSTM